MTENRIPLRPKVEYIKIHSFPENTSQIWKIHYNVGEILHNGTKARIGQAILDGKAALVVKRGRKSKIITYDGFITDWLTVKQCKIIGHDEDFFNFILPPKQKKKKGSKIM